MNRKKTGIWLIAGWMSVLAGCDSRRGAEPAEQHDVLVPLEGTGLLYADRADTKSVIQETDTTNSNTRFHCIKIGFVDSLAMARATDKKMLEEGQYFQYTIQDDWCVLVKGDTVRPVFYQPRQKTAVHRNEGILVFEVPGEQREDSLVYTDSRGIWGVQQLILK